MEKVENYVTPEHLLDQLEELVSDIEILKCFVGVVDAVAWSYVANVNPKCFELSCLVSVLKEAVALRLEVALCTVESCTRLREAGGAEC